MSVTSDVYHDGTKSCVFLSMFVLLVVKLASSCVELPQEINNRHPSRRPDHLLVWFCVSTSWTSNLLEVGIFEV